jgi:hypothetical protein
MAKKAIIAKRKHKAKKWEDPKVILDDPSKEKRYDDFIKETEGKENKGGDPRADAPIYIEASKEQLKRQAAALARLKKRGYLFDK